MAIQRFTKVICDTCGGEDGVKTVEVKIGTDKTKIDLCTNDQKPLTEILKAVQPARRGRPKGSGRTLAKA